jgi:hypothetical protein
MPFSINTSRLRLNQKVLLSLSSISLANLASVS